MKILGLHHAQITVPRGAEDQARSFYCGVLGLAEIPKPTSLADRGGIWLAVGDGSVHVGTEDGVERQRTKAHLAYEVNNLTQWRDHLTRQGVALLEGVPIPGFDRFELRDPFGNRVELIQRLT